MNGVTKVRGTLKAAALAILLALGASGADAQGLLNKLKEKAKPKVETNGQTGTSGAGESGGFNTTGMGRGDGNGTGGSAGASAVWPGNANVSPMSVDKTSVQVQTWRRAGAGA